MTIAKLCHSGGNLGAQKKDVRVNSKDLLISLYQKHLKTCHNNLIRLRLCVDLQKLYRWTGDNIMVLQMQKQMDEINRQFEQERREKDVEIAAAMGLTIEELKAMHETARNELKAEAARENNISDEEFEAYIEKQSLCLDDERLRSEFIRIAHKRWKERTPDDTMSVKEELELDLQNMMKVNPFL